MTYFQAAVTLLTYTDRPLTVGELTASAIDQGLIRPRGKTPDRSMSSVLYRRMAGDPDAPVISSDGRFWLRDRSAVTAGASALHSPIRQVARRVAGAAEPSRPAPQRQSRPAHTTLPPPPAIVLPADVLQAALQARTGRAGQTGGGLADRLQRFFHSRLQAALHTEGYERWDAARTYTRVVAPLLTLLGYRRAARRDQGTVRGRQLLTLAAGAEPMILLEVLRLAHVVSDADARPALARAVDAGVAWVLLTNGQELRLYTTHIAEALSDPTGALVLRVSLTGCVDEQRCHDSALQLWLLTSGAVVQGALEAYLATRAVGAALLGALEQADTPLVAALSDAVFMRTGLRLPAPIVARHARLAVRTGRARDGAPLPSAIAGVAAIAPLRNERPARSAQQAAS